MTKKSESNKFGVLDLILLAVIVGSITVLVYSLTKQEVRNEPLPEFRETAIPLEDSGGLKSQFDKRVREIKPGSQ